MTFSHSSRNVRYRALCAAFPYTVPILTGFLFLGMTYGIYMRSLGFSFFYPMAMSTAVFAGSMEFLTADMLCGTFQPLSAFLVALMVNARHLFYGISMLDRYRGTGKKKCYLIFGLCDETFSLNCTVNVPPDVDKGWFYFFVTLLDQLYWITGATLGGICGSFLHFDLEGLDFVMTAMFFVIFLNQWEKEGKKLPISECIGLCLSFLCLLVFGAEKFLLPSMLSILLLLTVLRPVFDRKAKGEETV